MPCPSCGEENPERAKFCLNCGTALAPRCPSCGEENPERAKFCLNCGTPLTGAAPPAPAPEPEPPPRVPDEERKLDTLVFVDLVGSTALAESLDPEDVLALLELYYTRLRAELERHGGTVEKYIGDAIVTHFGVPVGREDDPERAVRAALDILGTVEALNAEDPIREIKVRIGVATGEVIVTHGQKAEEGKGIAWGDVLNTAARIESAAPVNGILVGEETYRATVQRIEYREHESIEAKGKDQPVPVWQAVGVKEAPARGRGRDATLVGRDAELAQLTALWERVRADGRPALATIVGEPGIGKSRLLSELTHRASEDGAVLWGHCLSYGEGITYWPIEEMLEGAAGILKSDAPETVSEKLGVLLGSLPGEDPDEFRSVAATLANLVGTPESPGASAGEMSQAELHWGIRRVFEHMAGAQPLVLVLEDLHWAEPTLFDLIDFVGEASAPILVLGTARPEVRELRPELYAEVERRAVIALSALGEEQSEALLAALLGERSLPPGSRAEMLLQNAAGNPLFLEETVRMLDDAGVLDGTGDLAELTVPTSLQAMIGSRLDGLPAQDKSIAHHASVVGTTFWSGAVADLHGTDAVDPNLEALEQRDVVRGADESSLADEREWSFKHALIRDVAYARVPKGRRADLHVRFADWIQDIPGAADELVEILAYHLEQACRNAGVGRSATPPPIARAVEALMQAAEKAERREGIREADRFYARALEVLRGEETELALEALLGRAGTLNTLGQLESADNAFMHVAESAAAFARQDLRARALLGRSVVAVRQGRGPAARAFVLEAEADAELVADQRTRARAIYWSSNISAWFEGEGRVAVDRFGRALSIAEELDDAALQLEGHMWMLFILYNLGDLNGADEQLARCQELLTEVPSLKEEARVMFLLGVVRYHQGMPDEGERHGLKAMEWLDRTGDSFYQLQNLRMLGLCAVARGDRELAKRRLEHALELAGEDGGPLVTELQRCLVDVLVQQDRLDDARDLVATAVTSPPPTDAYARAACLLMQAYVTTDDLPTTRSYFEDALRLVEEQKLPLDLGEIRVAYSRVLRRAGDEAGAASELERARRDVADTGALGILREIDRELSELRDGAGQAGSVARS